MTAAVVFTGTAVEDVQFTVFHRFCAVTGSGAASPVTKEGNLITQANVSGIAVRVYDSSGTQISTTLAPTAASTVFDTLQTTLTFGNLTLGGNFRYSIPGTYFPCGGDSVTIEIMVTLTDGTILPALWLVRVLALVGS